MTHNETVSVAAILAENDWHGVNYKWSFVFFRFPNVKMRLLHVAVSSALVSYIHISWKLYISWCWDGTVFMIS